MSIPVPHTIRKPSAKATSRLPNRKMLANNGCNAEHWLKSLHVGQQFAKPSMIVLACPSPSLAMFSRIMIFPVYILIYRLDIIQSMSLVPLMVLQNLKVRRKRWGPPVVTGLELKRTQFKMSKILKFNRDWISV